MQFNHDYKVREVKRHQQRLRKDRVATAQETVHITVPKRARKRFRNPV